MTNSRLTMRMEMGIQLGNKQPWLSCCVAWKINIWVSNMP